jgi:hypothetical protein
MVRLDAATYCVTKVILGPRWMITGVKVRREKALDFSG